MRTSETRRIGEHEYTVRMLKVDTAIDILIDLIGMLGEPIAELLIAGESSALGAGLEQEDLEDTEANRGIAILLKVLVGKLHKDRIRHIIRELVAVSDVNNVSLSKEYDAHFRGEIFLLAQWLWFALQAQYRDFSGAFEAIVGSATRQPGQDPEG